MPQCEVLVLRSDMAADANIVASWAEEAVEPAAHAGVLPHRVSALRSVVAASLSDVQHPGYGGVARDCSRPGTPEDRHEVGLIDDSY